jgi:hypothetical protein
MTTMVAPKIGLASVGCANEVFDRVKVPATLGLLRHDFLNGLSQEIGSLKSPTCSDTGEISGDLLRKPKCKLSICSLSHCIAVCSATARRQARRGGNGGFTRERAPFAPMCLQILARDEATTLMRIAHQSSTSRFDT